MATDTAVEVVMPQMGVSVSEGTITRWTKAVGDRIEADETIVEISTDKVDTEVPSPAAGTVTALEAQEGETVPVGTRIAVIDTGGGVGDGEMRSTAPPRVEEARSASAPAEARSASAPAEASGDGGESTGPRGPAATPEPAPAEAGGNGDASGRTFVSPVVARMVAEHGLDVAAIPGTGRGGRVTKKDVQAFIESGGTAAPAGGAVHDVPHFAPPAEPEAPAAAPTTTAPAAPARIPAAPATAGDVGPGEELYQFNTIRKVIARHMRHSLETAAQVTTVIEVDMTRIVEMRRRWKPAYAERYGVNLTYIPFVALATIDAIRQWPWVNAEVRGDSAIIKRYVNLGMAVAIDDAKGLMVPVIHNAETLNIVGLSRAVIEKAEKARTKTLTPDEMANGTFTITNPGVFGALMGTPIIPEGQVAILDVEAIVKRPMVVSDEFGGDSIAIRHMMYLCLSYDHRLVDGAYAAQFMALLKRSLETWDEARFGLS
jgi:2-oxoglutarate dehydrogenase E2 component (dihydrolipoamide succinyltransferase)